jgi:two-component system nitrogen regulation response regulator GlnG
MRKLLVIDDEPNLLYSIHKTLSSASLAVETADTARAGLRSVADNRPDAVILDVRLPDMSGLDAFTEIRRIDPRLPVIIITAHGTTETAIEATKRGAYDYLVKPVPFDQLRDVVNRAIEISRMSHVPTRIDNEREDGLAAETIIGRTPAMQEVYKAIGRVAPQDVTVLIEGESGTGKEMVARAIYQHSRRSGGPFLAINCASIPDSLLESELFGHERGAFTGAERQRIGKFEQVNGGTLFLDEIGDMSPSSQAKVLRLLQDGSFERVGSNQTIRSDVRVISATNRRLEEMVERGEFRQDLYYRLKVFSIVLPPLRDRLDDLPALVDYFMRTSVREIPIPVRGISDEALQLLHEHDWPGNIRELKSVVQHAMINAVGEPIMPEFLPEGFRKGNVRTESGDVECSEAMFPGVIDYVQSLLKSGEPAVYRKLHAEIDRVLFRHTLDSANGNQLQVAQILGIARSTLRTRIESLGLSIEKRVSEGASAQESP